LIILSTSSSSIMSICYTSIITWDNITSLTA
jgi:hypothetical protein